MIHYKFQDGTRILTALGCIQFDVAQQGSSHGMQRETAFGDNFPEVFIFPTHYFFVAHLIGIECYIAGLRKKAISGL